MRSQALLIAALTAALTGISGAAGVVGGALAQNNPRSNVESGGPTWEAAALYDYVRLSGGREDWRWWTLSLKRETSRGTLMGTFLRQRRFGVEEEGVRIDVWADLWARAYGHIQTGLSPSAHVRPRGTIRAEVYQSFGPWELSGRYSWRRYRSEDVQQFGPGLGWYVGSWYLRTRTSLVPRRGTWGIAQRVGARRFYGPQSSLSHIDLEGGLGRSVELINARSEILVTRTFFVGLRLRHFLTSHLGITASVRYSDDDVYRRTGGALGFFGRW